MIIKKVDLEKVCGRPGQLTVSPFPEYAFAGKSNVGKSSLINALMNRKSYARTSAEPGKTQTINYYNINDRLYLVDLPGYGYAKVSRAVREQWGYLIEGYFQKTATLKAIFLLVDIRHDPSAGDKQMFDWIVAEGFTPVVIATKLDKIKRSQTSKQLKAVRDGLGMTKDQTLIAFSAKDKTGRDRIWEIIEEGLADGIETAETPEGTEEQKGQEHAQIG